MAEEVKQETFGDCECCLRKYVPIAGFGAAALCSPSILWCRECIKNVAEPEWMIKFAIEYGTRPTEYLKKLKVYRGDKYILVADIYDELVKEIAEENP